MTTRLGQPKPYLTVLTLEASFKQYGFNAFSTKLYFRLRHAGIPYADGHGTRGQSPKKKVPYVRFEDTGELMGDTGLITQRLVKEGRLEDLNARLPPAERAADFCLRSMVEDRLYYFLVREKSPKGVVEQSTEAVLMLFLRFTSGGSSTPRR